MGGNTKQMEQKGRRRKRIKREKENRKAMGRTRKKTERRWAEQERGQKGDGQTKNENRKEMGRTSAKTSTIAKWADPSKKGGAQKRKP